jgi:hypothetical protein
MCNQAGEADALVPRFKQCTLGGVVKVVEVKGGESLALQNSDAGIRKCRLSPIPASEF